jgi:murein DD-endopeptidase MepM/ murein hydrolase activator NlpD
MKGTADALGLEMNLYPAPGGLRTLVPVPLTTKPGRHQVRVVVGNREARVFMTVAKRPVHPVRQIHGLIVSPEKAEALRTDKGRLGRVLSGESREALWSAVLRRPVLGPVTAKYGVPRSYGGGAGWVHKGADFAMPRNWPVIAPTGGTVRLARLMGSYGNIIVVDHGQGVFTTYLHLRSFLVKQEDLVEAGQVIGTVGATGMATGPHLHFGVFIHRVAVDPVEFLAKGLP